MTVLGFVSNSAPSKPTETTLTIGTRPLVAVVSTIAARRCCPAVIAVLASVQPGHQPGRHHQRLRRLDSLVKKHDFNRS